MTSSNASVRRFLGQVRGLAAVVWASPCSLLGAGIGLLMLLAGGSVRRAGPALECALPSRLQASRLVRCLPFSAITFGHVVLGNSPEELARLRNHEQVHVRQYERLGVLFFIAYPMASLIAWTQGRCPYRGNRYEVEAYGAEAQVSGECLPAQSQPQQSHSMQPALDGQRACAAVPCGCGVLGAKEPKREPR